MQALNRPFHFAVVDEVDSILIDEARNPFIVNMPGADNFSHSEWTIAVRVSMLLKGPPVPENMHPDELISYFEGIPMEEFMSVDYIPDYRIKGATITRKGMAKAVKLLSHPSIARIYMVSAIKDEEKKVSGETTAPTHVALLEIDQTEEFGEDTNRSASVGRLVVRKLQESENEVSTWNTDSQDEIIELADVSLDSLCDALMARQFLHIPYETVIDSIYEAAIAPVLWSGGSKSWGRYLNQAVRAVHAFKKNIDYIVRDGEVVVIDTATGRERERSRWQAGLHQAIEAKELVLQADPNIEIRPEDFDQGRVTYQVLFSEYQTLSGMTGTAATEAEEFEEAYELSIVRIPPHRPSQRIDLHPLVYGSKEGWRMKLQQAVRDAVIDGRPVLVATMSVEASEEVLEVVKETALYPSLNEIQSRILASALSRVPSTLPSPPIKDLLLAGGLPGDSKIEALNPEARSAIAFYISVKQKYPRTSEFLHKFVREGSISTDEADEMKQSIMVLRDVLTTRAWSLRNQMEADAIKDILELLIHSVKESKIGNKVKVNLLNARPDRARKEAEIIAQAGLPATVTVATSMAGRGTDILLGGNPKGLTLLALKYIVLPLITDEKSPECDPPLSGIHPAWTGSNIEDSMRDCLPESISSACFDIKAKELHEKLLFQDAITFLEGIIEMTELFRANFGLQNEGETEIDVDLDRCDSWIRNELSESGMLVTGSFEFSTGLEEEILRYSLLQWLWFDRECKLMGEKVRGAGGLSVVIASIPETRRTELQLRGRAGRQGDPGSTSVVASLEDPLLTSALMPKQKKDIWLYIEESGGADGPLPSLVIDPVIKTLTRNQEQMQQSARDVARKYDAVIDAYRRHVYRLRRIMNKGGEMSRSVLFHADLRAMSEELVSYHCSANLPLDQWNLDGLLTDIGELLYSPGLKIRMESQSAFPNLPQSRHPSQLSISMHFVDEFLMAMLEEVMIDQEESRPSLVEDLRNCLKGKKSVDGTAMPILDFKSTKTPIAPLRRKALLNARKEAILDGNAGTKHAYQRLVLWVGDTIAVCLYLFKNSCSYSVTFSSCGFLCSICMKTRDTLCKRQ